MSKYKHKKNIEILKQRDKNKKMSCDISNNINNNRILKDMHLKNQYKSAIEKKQFNKEIINFNKEQECNIKKEIAELIKYEEDLGKFKIKESEIKKQEKFKECLISTINMLDHNINLNNKEIDNFKKDINVREDKIHAYINLELKCKYLNILFKINYL